MEDIIRNEIHDNLSIAKENIKNLVEQDEKISNIEKSIEEIDNITDYSNYIFNRINSLYFRIFNNLIVSDSIISKTLGINPKYKYAWDK